MLCFLGIGIVSFFTKASLSGPNHYVKGVFLYMMRAMRFIRRGFLCYGLVWRRVISLSASLDISCVEHPNFTFPFGLVSYIATWWGCEILNNCLLFLWRERITKNNSLISEILHILLDLFKAWEIFGEVIKFATNHVGELYFFLSFVVYSKCILCLLCILF